MCDEVSTWLEENAGDYGFPWAIQFLSSAVLVILSFGGVMYLFDDSSARDVEYYISAVALPLLILLTFMYLRALIFARRLRISKAGLEVTPIGIAIAADDILSIRAYESGRRLKLSIQVGKVRARICLPGYQNLKPNTYEVRAVRKETRGISGESRR